MQSQKYEEQLVTSDKYSMTGIKTPLSILFVALFVISAVSFDAIGGYSNITIGLGALCGIVFVFYSIRQGIVISGDVWFFAAFVIWSSGSLFNARFFPVAVRYLLTMVQFLAMLVIISNYCRNIKSSQVMLASLLIGITIVSFISIITGQYNDSFLTSDEAGRVVGLTGNANSFGMYMFYLAGVLLFFFKSSKSLLVKIGCLAFLLFVARFVVATGSREAFICFGILIIVWFLLTYRTEIFKKPILTFGALIVFFSFLVYLYFELLSSDFIERFVELASIFGGGGKLGGSTSIRASLIQQGIETIKNYPLVGVGFSNTFFYNSHQLYFHNNYIEVTACTGILGGILYYSVFFVLWRRLRRLNSFKGLMDSKEIALLNCAKSLLFVRLISDISRVSYYNKVNWVFFAIMIGWSYHVLKKYSVLADFQYTEQDFETEYEYLHDYAAN